MPYCHLSDEMYFLFNESFNNPFANNIYAMFLNEATQERFLTSNTMMEFEASRISAPDDVLSKLGLA